MGLKKGKNSDAVSGGTLKMRWMEKEQEVLVVRGWKGVGENKRWLEIGNER